MTKRTKRLASKKHSQPVQKSAPTTLGGHLGELKGRLFSVVAVFIVAACAAYPFFDKISNFLLAPLDQDRELVYLTPGGAFSYVIMTCFYIGAIATLPVIIYHIYRFIMPAVEAFRLRSVLRYTLASILLAILGMLFAYFIGLPAALNFLTSFDLNNIDPMLTIDSYMSFVMTYLLAGAALFQLPIIMMIINKIKPLSPKKLMGAQDKIILGSFIVAAVISPTPDALNQTLLAMPMILMYQLGIFVVWLSNRKRSPVTSEKLAHEADLHPPESKHLHTAGQHGTESEQRHQPISHTGHVKDLAVKKPPRSIDAPLPKQSLSSPPMRVRKSMDIIPPSRTMTPSRLVRPATKKAVSSKSLKVPQRVVANGSGRMAQSFDIRAVYYK